MAWEEYVVNRLHDLVYRALPPVPSVSVLGPVAALDELSAWVADDHQWAEGRWRNWHSLLDELLVGWDAMPYTIKTFAAASDAVPLTALRQGRGRLAQDKDTAASDQTLRTVLAQAETDLRAVLGAPGALSAAWTDLVRAVRQRDWMREQHALALLASVSELQGKPWRPLSRRLWGALGDDENEINAIRAEMVGEPRPDPAVPPRRASERAAVRLALAEQALSLPAPAGDLIVWLAFVRAHVPGGMVEVGPAVTLFDGRWLRDFLANWGAVEDAQQYVPEEVVDHREMCAESWESDRPDEPFALVRIAIGAAPIARALDEAHATAVALLRLAAFYDRGRSCWRDSGAYIIFVDGKPEWRTLGIDADLDDHGATLDLACDQTAVKLADLASTVGPHLPVTDPDVRAALDLLRWLTEARRTWGPAALLLNDRVLEQVAGWTGHPDSRRFATERLALAWAFSQATTEIVDAGIQAVMSIDRSGGLTPPDPTRRAAYLEATGARDIVQRNGMAGDSGNVANVIDELVWLRGWQEPGADGDVRLAALESRVASGSRAARWLRELTGEFTVLLKRAKRTRNAIAHGGPISDASLRTVGRFLDEVASDALNQALYARLTGQDPAASFDQRQQRLDRAVDDLEQGRITPAKGLLVI